MFSRLNPIYWFNLGRVDGFTIYVLFICTRLYQINSRFSILNHPFWVPHLWKPSDMHRITSISPLRPGVAPHSASRPAWARMPQRRTAPRCGGSHFACEAPWPELEGDEVMSLLILCEDVGLLGCFVLFC